MKPKTLSASAIKAYEACPAMFRAKYIVRDPDPPGDFALRGTVIHAVLEEWVATGLHAAGLTESAAEAEMTRLVEKHYWDHLSHGNELEFCVEQCLNWLRRAEVGEVLSTETKLRFDLPTSAGMIPVSYIIDRVDRLDETTLEAVDYKSWIRNITGHELRWDIQARIYALAVMIQYPGTQTVWVTFDQTRYRDIGVPFTREDCEFTWRYLKHVAERILADTGDEERLNSECRYCPRKRICGSLKRHRRIEGQYSVEDVDETVALRHEVANQIKALEAFLGELDGHVLAHADHHDIDEWQSGEVAVSVGSKASRSLDQRKLAQVLGADAARFVERFGGFTLTAVDKALRDSEFLSDVQRREIDGLVEEKYAGLRVSTFSVSPILAHTQQTPEPA